MAENIIDMREIISCVTMKAKITHEQEMIWRIKLGVRVMLLAAWIMGCQIEIEDLPERESSDGHND
jgi:hypothetical protein